MKKNRIVMGSVVGGALALLPFIASAAASDVIGALETVQSILNLLIPIVITLAIVYFLYGLAEFVLAVDEEKKRKEGKGIMLWGIMALVIIFFIGGITSLVAKTFGIQGAAQITPIHVGR